MNVVAKFFCESVVTDQDTKISNVTMRPDYPKDDAPDHPNRAFWQATPSGSLQMCITNPSAADAFKAGQVYTVTFEVDTVEAAAQAD